MQGVYHKKCLGVCVGGGRKLIGLSDRAIVANDHPLIRERH